MKILAVKMIEFYQKFISPYKGFKCAHGIHTKEITCSGYGKKVISKYGIFTGLKLLNRRFYDCSWSAKKLQAQVKNESYKKYQPVGRYKTQGGFIDADCGSCDIPSCDLPSCDLPGCDIPSCDVPTLECFGNSCDLFTDLIFFDNCVSSNCATSNCLPECGPTQKYKQAFVDKRNKRNEQKYGKLEETTNEKNPQDEEVSKKEEDSEDY